MTAIALDKLFANMQNSKGVPALETVVTSILNSLSDHKNGKVDLVADITKDFALTQKVLKLANSPMYAPFAQGIDSISSALDILGSDALLHIVLSVTMMNTTELEQDLNLAKTLFAAELARSLQSNRSEDVSIAALMFDLGRLMATRYLPEEMAVVNQKITSGVEPDVAALSVLGMSLEQVGTAVAKRWRIPHSIVSIIDGTGDQTLVKIANFSNCASSLIHEGKMTEANKLVSSLEIPGADKSNLAMLINRKIEERIAHENKPPNTSAETALHELLATLSEEKKNTAEELATAIFSEASRCLNITHSLLFILTQSGDFSIRYGYGKGIDALRSKFRISSNNQPTAFHAAIKNNVDLSIVDVSKLKASSLPENYKSLLPNVNKFIVLPIATGSVSGLIYYDWESEKELSQTELAILRKLRDLFPPFFPK